MFKEKAMGGLICLLAIMLAIRGWATDIDETIRALKNKETRREAAVALEEMGTSAVPSLLSAMTRDERLTQDGRREAIVLVLKSTKKVKDRSTRIPLEKILAEDEDRAIREIAAFCLGELQDKAAIPKLKESMKKDPNKGVRMRAALALAQLGDYSGKEPALLIIEEGKGGNPSLFAVDVLIKIGDKKIIPRLKKNLESKRSWTRIYSKLAIKKLEKQDLSDEKELVFLKEALDDPQYEIEKWSVKELERIIRRNQPLRDEALSILKKSQSLPAHKVLMKLFCEGKVYLRELLTPEELEKARKKGSLEYLEEAEKYLTKEALKELKKDLNLGE